MSSLHSPREQAEELEECKDLEVEEMENPSDWGLRGVCSGIVLVGIL